MSMVSFQRRGSLPEASIPKYNQIPLHVSKRKLISNLPGRTPSPSSFSCSRSGNATQGEPVALFVGQPPMGLPRPLPLLPSGAPAFSFIDQKLARRTRQTRHGHNAMRTKKDEANMMRHCELPEVPKTAEDAVAAARMKVDSIRNAIRSGGTLGIGLHQSAGTLAELESMATESMKPRWAVQESHQDRAVFTAGKAPCRVHWAANISFHGGHEDEEDVGSITQAPSKIGDGWGGAYRQRKRSRVSHQGQWLVGENASSGTNDKILMSSSSQPKAFDPPLTPTGHAFESTTNALTPTDAWSRDAFNRYIVATS